MSDFQCKSMHAMYCLTLSALTVKYTAHPKITHMHAWLPRSDSPNKSNGIKNPHGDCDSWNVLSSRRCCKFSSKNLQGVSDL